MQLAKELRRLAASSRLGCLERAHERHRLTVAPIADSPGFLAFTLSEAKSRGWTPILAGQITEADDLAISFCASPAAVGEFDRVTGAILAEPSPRVADAPRTPERESARGRVPARRLPA